jgi:hypothetical protein
VASGWEKGHMTKSGLVKKRYRCELCNIDITNKKNLDKHKAGKKHMEKLQEDKQISSEVVWSQDMRQLALFPL